MSMMLQKNLKLVKFMLLLQIKNIIELIKNNGGKAVFTIFNHQTGTDRIYEVLKISK